LTLDRAHRSISRFWRPAISALASVAVVGALAAGAGHADPASDALAKLNELSRQAEQTTEAMHSAQLDLNKKLEIQQGASLVNRLLRSANAPRHAPAPAPPIDDETLRVADDLCARLDERAARLETLLREAKDAIARLEALSAAASSTANEHRRAPRARQRAAVSDAPQHDPPLVEVSRAAAPASIAGATLAADPLCARVYELADAGADAVSIAKQLSEHTGKVQLILALRAP